MLAKPILLSEKLSTVALNPEAQTMSCFSLKKSYPGHISKGRSAPALDAAQSVIPPCSHSDQGIRASGFTPRKGTRPFCRRWRSNTPLPNRRGDHGGQIKPQPGYGETQAVARRPLGCSRQWTDPAFLHGSWHRQGRGHGKLQSSRALSQKLRADCQCHRCFPEKNRNLCTQSIGRGDFNRHLSSATGAYAGQLGF